MPRPIVVMGVQGTGKSTVGAGLAKALSMDFVDGDSLHPESNKAKMAAGVPLSDDDRHPWLVAIGERIAQQRDYSRPIVVVCSALKRSYRDLLRSYAPDLLFVHLYGTPELVAERIASRPHEYMPASLLQSQFATLQPLADHEAGVTVSIEPEPSEVVRLTIANLEAQKYSIRAET